MDPEKHSEVKMILGMIYEIYSETDVEIKMMKGKEKNKLSIGAYVLFISLISPYICILKAVCH